MYSQASGRGGSRGFGGSYWNRARNESHSASAGTSSSDGRTSQRGKHRGGRYSHSKRWSGKQEQGSFQTRYDRPSGSTESISPGHHQARTISSRPQGLRGKEIGLWYARKGKEKKEHRNRLVVDIDNSVVSEMQNKLHQIRAADRVNSSDVPSEPGPSNLYTSFSNADSSLTFVSSEFIKSRPANEFIMTYLENLSVNAGNKKPDLFEDFNRLKRNNSLDKLYHENFMKRLYNGGPVGEFRKKLPTFDKRQAVLDLVHENQTVVISGETGCGKTTQVPQYILDDMIMNSKGSLCNVICTQPRRISATSVARRVATERGEKLGESVGYSIRLDSVLPRSRASITYCTTGILLRRLARDIRIDNVSHVIVDEVHERDIQTDFLLILLKDLMTTRPELKIILMSATLNAELFSAYFHNAPSIHIPGFTHPVTSHYMEDLLQVVKYSPPPFLSSNPDNNAPRNYRFKKPQTGRFENRDDLINWAQNNTSLQKLSPQSQRSLFDINYEKIHYDLVVNLIHHICLNEPPGAILLFLPGWSEIKDIKKLLEARLANRFTMLLIVLHSMVSWSEQTSVFNRPPPGVRKIILATNIAETSITVDDVVFVIDSGKIKLTDYDSERNMHSLCTKWISLANLKQRRGRAGRVQPGQSYHLFTRYHEGLMDDSLKPEILRMRLEEVCLNVKLLGQGKIIPFISKALAQPELQALTKSIDHLIKLGALDTEENLTPLGFHLAQLPMNPQIGKMMVMSSVFCCIDPILTVAACLNHREPFVVPMGKEKEVDQRRKDLSRQTQSDHLMYYYTVKGYEEAVNKDRYCYDNFLTRSNMEMIRKLKLQFAEILHEKKFIKTADPQDYDANIHSDNTALVRAILCSGLYPNVAMYTAAGKVKKGVMRIKTKTESRASLHKKCVSDGDPAVFDMGQWLVFHEIIKMTAVSIMDSTVMPALPILFFGDKLVRKLVTPEYSDPYKAVIVDDWITFKCPSEQADLIENMRGELDKVLQERILSPQPTNWNPSERQGVVLPSIIKLITQEKITVSLYKEDLDHDE